MELEQIQGNIIGFNKTFQHFYFLNLGEDRKKMRDWVRDITKEVTSADDVLRFRQALRGEGDRVNEPWLNLAFTYAGLVALTGVSSLAGFPQEFVDGMAKRADILGDLGENAPGNWKYPRETDLPVHALLILAANEEDVPNFDRLVTDRRNSLSTYGIRPVYEQRGRDRQNARGRDHFGFKDGISQPAFNDPEIQRRDPRKEGQDLIWPGEFVLGYRRQDPSLATDDGAAEDPPPVLSPEWTKDGSYLVFRRLTQNVEEFENFVRDESNKHGLSEAMFMAKLVGRYRSGASLAAITDQELADADGADPGEKNPQSTLLEAPRLYNFGFAGDEDGNRVPRGAHSRRLNPRDQAIPGRANVQTRRILRRGIPFEDREGNAVERGLLFICYQRSIKDQYEFLQQSWANDPYFPAGTSNIRPGRDPLIGQGRTKGADEPKFNIPGLAIQGDKPADHVTLMKWVTVTGGDYFFSPSKTTLRGLSREDLVDQAGRKMAEAEEKQAKAERELSEAIGQKRSLVVGPVVSFEVPDLGAAEDALVEAERQLAAARREHAAARRRLAAAKEDNRMSTPGAKPRPVPPPPGTITGFGDCRLQITVAFNGLDDQFYYPWRVWVRGAPVWTSQWGEYLVPNNLGFATGTMWMRIQQILEALDPDLTAGEIVQSRWNNEPADAVLGAYAKWEVELITRADTGDGKISAILKLDPASGKLTSLDRPRASQDTPDWTTERVGEFFPIDVGVWPG